MNKAMFDRLVDDNRGSDAAMAAAKVMHPRLPDCDPTQHPTCPACEEAGPAAVAAAEAMLEYLAVE